MEDNRRHPIDASPRRRFPTRRQRRVVDVRDPECARDGCHAGDILQYDHREPYDLVHHHGIRAMDAWHLALASLTLPDLAEPGEERGFATRDQTQATTATHLGSAIL